MMRVLMVAVLLGTGYVLLAGGDRRPVKDKEAQKISEKEWQKEVLAPAGPVLADFWATWCGPCRKMMPVVDKLAKEFKVVKVDVDANEALADRYGVDAVPTFLLFKDGKVAKRFEGVVEEATLRNALKELSPTK